MSQRRTPCPKQNRECPLFDTKAGCFADKHHIFWPAHYYRTPLEKDFRELPQNKELTCRDEHNEIHATEYPPKKPSTQEMIQAISQVAIEGTHEQAA